MLYPSLYPWVPYSSPYTLPGTLSRCTPACLPACHHVDGVTCRVLYLRGDTFLVEVMDYSPPFNVFSSARSLRPAFSPFPRI